MTEDSRITHPPSADVKARATRCPWPRTSRASIWITSLLGRDFTAYRLAFRTRTFFLLYPFALLSTLSCFTLDLFIFERRRASLYTRPLRTHRRAHHYHSVNLHHFGHRCSSLRRRVVCRRHYHLHVRPSTLSPFAPRILVLYCPSLAYINPAPGLVKGGHLRPISPSCFTLCASYQTRPTTNRTDWVVARLSGPVLLSTFVSDIYLTPRSRYLRHSSHRLPPYGSQPTTAIRLGITDRSALSSIPPHLARLSSYASSLFRDRFQQLLSNSRAWTYL
jgi:hypothetical protein